MFGEKVQRALWDFVRFGNKKALYGVFKLWESTQFRSFTG
jgi:hypothetical protein